MSQQPPDPQWGSQPAPGPQQPPHQQSWTPPPPQQGWGGPPTAPPRATPSPVAGTGGSDQTRRLAAAALLIIVAGTYLAVLAQTLGRDLSFSVNRIDNVFFVWFTSATFAALLLGLAAGLIRRRWPALIAVIMLGFHVLVLLIIVVVQLVIGAEPEYLAVTGVALFGVLVGAGLAVLGLRGAARQAGPGSPVVPGVVAAVGATVSVLLSTVVTVVTIHIESVTIGTLLPSTIISLLLSLLTIAAMVLLTRGAQGKGSLPFVLALVALGLLAVVGVINGVTTLGARGVPVGFGVGQLLQAVVMLLAALAVVLTMLSRRGDPSAPASAPTVTPAPMPHPVPSANQPPTNPAPQPGPYPAAGQAQPWAGQQTPNRPPDRPQNPSGPPPT